MDVRQFWKYQDQVTLKDGSTRSASKLVEQLSDEIVPMFIPFIEKIIKVDLKSSDVKTIVTGGTALNMYLRYDKRLRTGDYDVHVMITSDGYHPEYSEKRMETYALFKKALELLFQKNRYQKLSYP